LRRGLDDPRRNAYVARVLPHLNELSALLSVVIIDIVLAGDNAIVVGMAAASLPAERRRRAILLGILAAMLLRILFAFCAVRLLHTVIGMTLAGGLLLLWVCWKMYRELAEARAVDAAAGAAPCSRTAVRRVKTTTQALLQIVLADLSMSLDNVLAVAGAARDHPYVLVVGLVLSVALMGVASTYIARLLGRHFWISWIGLGIITFVALRMIWAGSDQLMHQAAALGL
jgi:YjbE family integral membrane protein